MKNLKKVLALVLSLAFVLTMFAGAITTVPETTNFSDAADMTAAGSEAVNVLSALGVVAGYPDGSFQPASLVTRAEFAKMMSALFEVYLEAVKSGDETSGVCRDFMKSLPESYRKETRPARIVADYISLMTDQYFLNQFAREFIPQKIDYDDASGFGLGSVR